ncbi:MFS transporter [Paenibacillus oleatilyticus]|uniref:MFS transporter n=1 Tax=Paenibacillus oleatilyticus TaxID=2594886 RepID=A0ABV4V3M0_9BACL
MNSLPSEEHKKMRLNIFSQLVLSKNFFALYMGQTLSSLGSSISFTIFPIIVYQITKSTAQMGLMMALSILPNVIMLPFSGVLVDKLNKVKIMLVVDFIRFSLLIFLSLMAFSGSLTMVHLCVFMFIFGLIGSIFQPAYSSVRAKVFTKEIRNAANSLTQISQRATRLIGPILGGVIITSLSPGWGLGIDAITYLISICFLFKLRSITFNSSITNKIKLNWKQDFIEGIDVLRQNSWLWITILACSFFNICSSGIGRILIPWLIIEHHHFEPVVYGMILSSSSAGAIACGVIYGMKQQLYKRGILAYLGVALSGIAVLVTPFVSNILLFMFLMFLNGAGVMLFALIWETSLQEMVPEDKFGRVSSLDFFGSFSLMPLGYIMTGWLSTNVGEINTTIILSISILLIAIAVLWNKGVRQYS